MAGQLDSTIAVTRVSYPEPTMTLEHISFDPAVMNGQPCVLGTRLTVKRVLQILAQCADREEIRKDYPRLTDDDIRDIHLYAAAFVEDRIEDLSS